MAPDDAEQPASSDPGWPWLPTVDGALLRDAVMSLRVERIDGDFEGGHKAMFFLHVLTAPDAEPIRLRPYFFDSQELSAWVDRVFPGASFQLLAPNALTEKLSSPAQPRSLGPFGSGASDAIRVIGDGLAGGNVYEPPQGLRPPPGAPPMAI